MGQKIASYASHVVLLSLLPERRGCFLGAKSESLTVQWFLSRDLAKSELRNFLGYLFGFSTPVICFEYCNVLVSGSNRSKVVCIFCSPRSPAIFNTRTQGMFSGAKSESFFF